MYMHHPNFHQNKFLGRKTTNADTNQSNPLIIQINLESEEDQQRRKPQCHYCYDITNDILQCSYCTTSFCSICVDELTLNKNMLNLLYTSLKERHKWICFKCKNECPCVRCSNSLINDDDDACQSISIYSCFVCNRTKNLTKAEKVIRIANENNKVKREIMEYEVFAPLFKKKNVEEIYLCHKCNNKILSIYESCFKPEHHFIKSNYRKNQAYEQSLYQKSNNAKEDEDEESEEQELEKKKSFKCIEAFVSSTKKDMKEIKQTDRIITSENTSNLLFTQSNSLLESSNNNMNNTMNNTNISNGGNNCINGISNLNNNSNSQNRIMYQPVIPFFQIAPQIQPVYQHQQQLSELNHQQLPQQQHQNEFQPQQLQQQQIQPQNQQLLQQSISYPYSSLKINEELGPNESNNAQIKIQPQLLILLYKNISFFFNNSFQSRMNLLNNVFLLTHYINITKTNNQSLQKEYSTLQPHINKLAEEINKHLNLLYSSHQELNELALHCDIKIELINQTKPPFKKNKRQFPKKKSIGNNSSLNKPTFKFKTIKQPEKKNPTFIIK